MKIKTYSVLLIFIVLFLCGCQNDRSALIQRLSAENDTYRKEIASLKGELENLKKESYFTNELNKLIWGDSLFDPDEIKVGDIVADMRLKEINGTKYVFEGQKTLEGDLTISDDEYDKGMISLAVDKRNANDLPRAINDLRTLWFQFENRDEAYEIVNNYKNGYIKVVIDNYVVDLKESEVINSATLIKAINE